MDNKDRINEKKIVKVFDEKEPSKSKLRLRIKELKNSNALQRKLGGANGPSCYMDTPQH